MSHDPVKVLLRCLCEVLTCLLADSTLVSIPALYIFFHSRTIDLDDTFHIWLNLNPTKTSKESHRFLDASKVALISVNNKKVNKK